MFRTLTVLAALLGLAAAAPAAEPPQLGKLIEIEFTDRDPKHYGAYYKAVFYPVALNQLYRVEIESIGDVEAKFQVLVWKSVGGGKFEEQEQSDVGIKKVDYYMKQPVPGNVVQLVLCSQELCKARVRISAFDQTKPTMPLGKLIEVEFTDRDPKYYGVFFKAVYCPIRTGQRFKIEMESLGDVEAKFHAIVSKDIGSGKFEAFEQCEVGLKRIDFTMTKSPPGNRVQIWLLAEEVCKARVRITRLGEDGKPTNDPGDDAAPPAKASGDEPNRPSSSEPKKEPGAPDYRDKLIKLLEEENASLKKRIADLEKQIDAGRKGAINPNKP